MFRKKTKSSLLKIVLLLCCSVCASTYAQESFKAYANYSALPVGDTLELSYQYKGNATLSAFDAHLKDYALIGGPNQRISSEGVSVGDSLVTTATTEIRYRIKMNKPGHFTIPAAEVKGDGRLYQSDPIEIEVKEGSFHKVQHPIPEKDATLKALLADYEQAGGRHQAIAKMSYPYVLITGFTYRRKAEKDGSKQIMLSIDSLMDKKAETLLLGSVVQDGKPRKYYGLSDTTGLRTKLQGLYNKHSSHARHAIMLIRKEDWEQNDEYRYFENANSTWEEIDQWTRNIAPAKQAMLNAWEVQFKCMVASQKDAKSLSTFATRNGYSIDSSYNQQNGLYTFLLKKQSDIIPEHLFALAQDLIDEMQRYKKSSGNPVKVYTDYAGMTVQKVSKEKK